MREVSKQAIKEGRKEAMSDKENQKGKRMEWESRLYKEG